MAAGEEVSVRVQKEDIEAPDNKEDAAAYLFDLLIAMRGVARDADLIFLSYLIEMAASEASRIAKGEDSLETEL